jgi:hypothetical protein
MHHVLGIVLSGAFVNHRDVFLNIPLIANLQTIHHESLLELGIQPIMVSLLQDMSSMWKALGRRAGCKVKTLFCCCCSIKSKDSAIERKIPCPSCIKMGQLRLYHRDTGDATTLEHLKY